MDKIIFITGGTGFLGSYILRQLLLEGQTRLIALKRPSSPMDLVEDIADRVKWVEADLLDFGAIETILKEATHVIHSAAVISFDPRRRKEMKKVNVEGTKNLVDLALHAGIEKMVHISSIAAIGREKKKQDGIDENFSWKRSKFNTHYAISKFLSEQEVWRGIAEGLPAVIINPSVILGCGRPDEGTYKIFQRIQKGLGGYPSGANGFVDVRDVARLTCILLNNAVLGERFIASNENLSYKKLFGMIARALNKKQPSLKVHLAAGEIAGLLASLLSRLTGKEPLLTRESARQVSRSYSFDNSKSKEALTHQYIPIEKTIEDTVQGLLKSVERPGGLNFLPLIEEVSPYKE